MAKPRVPRGPVVQPLDPSYKLIALTKGQVSLVDASDYVWLMQWNWCALWNRSIRGFYAVRSQLGRTFYMHREILNYNSGDVDHRNHDTLDNRRLNLRPATRSQNNANTGMRRNNTSGLKGVSWSKGRKKWEASARTNGAKVSLGFYLTKEAAHAAYCAFVKRKWGEFACVD